MNQKAVIYIILSAIRLYLYYRSHDLSVFAAFAVLVGVTLMSPTALSNDIEGFTLDKECDKLGFTGPKLVKGDLAGSLEKEVKKIKKVADKYWPYDDKMESKDEAEQKSMKEFYGVFMKEAKKQEDDSKKGEDFITVCREIYNSKERMVESNIKSGLFKPYISGGNIVLKILTNVGKSKEIKDAGAKKIVNYLTCLCKHWIDILQKTEEAASGSSGDAGESDKKKNKNKMNKNKNNNNNNNKKSKKNDEDEDD